MEKVTDIFVAGFALMISVITPAAAQGTHVSFPNAESPEKFELSKGLNIEISHSK